MIPGTPVSVTLELSPQIMEKLQHYCATHHIPVHDVIEHAIEEWYASANVN